MTHDQEISTQQAAEILGLSRPTVVRLIDEGKLDAHVPGTVRRKLRLAQELGRVCRRQPPQAILELLEIRHDMNAVAAILRPLLAQKSQPPS